MKYIKENLGKLKKTLWRRLWKKWILSSSRRSCLFFN